MKPAPYQHTPEDMAWTLSSIERRVLIEMCREIGWSAGRIAEWTGLPAKVISAAHKALYAAGLANFGVLICENDGLLAGRGYWLSPAGWDVRCHILNQRWPR